MIIKFDRILNYNEIFEETMICEETTSYFRVGKLIFDKLQYDCKIPYKIEFEKNNKVIILFLSNHELINKVKTISDKKWNPQEKHCDISYSENLIIKLQTLFGKNISVDHRFYLIALYKKIFI